MTTPAKKPQAVAPAAEAGGFKSPGGGIRASIRDRIAAVAPYTSELVTIPEWDNVQVEVRSLSLSERNAMMADADGDLDMSSLFPQLVMRCTFDPESGERVFGDDDVAFINSRPADLVDRIAMPALKLSGMTAESVDEAAKKSLETENSDSGS